MATTRTAPNRNSMAPGGSSGARWVSIAVGAWVFVSVFLWPHSDGSETNSWIVGGLMAGVGVWALFMPRARWINTVLAVWLFVSTLFIPHLTSTTVWNNAIAAIVVFFASLVPNAPIGTTGRRHGAAVTT